MDVSSSDGDLVNSCDLPTDPAPPFGVDSSPLFIPPGRRHAIPRRVTSNEASPTEMLHHLLGAHASDTLTGALTQAHIFAEMIAEHLASERGMGTLANHVVAQLEVCLALCEGLDIDGGAR